MITSKDINAKGEVTLYETTEEGTRPVAMASVDAAHALDSDPKRWSLTPPKAVEDEIVELVEDDKAADETGEEIKE